MRIFRKQKNKRRGKKSARDKIFCVAASECWKRQQGRRLCVFVCDLYVAQVCADFK